MLIVSEKLTKTKTRGSQEPVSLTLVYDSMCILNNAIDTDKFMTKLCFCDGDVFGDLALLNILATYNFDYI